MLERGARRARTAARDAMGLPVLLCVLLLASACTDHGGGFPTPTRPSTQSATPTEPPRVPPSYAGVYVLTITAGACSGEFPDGAKRRVYTARVEQTGADLRVSLSGADFQPFGHGFAGAVGPTGDLRFEISPVGYWDYGGPDLQERLSEGTVLVIHGAIRASGTAERVSGTVDSSARMLWLPPMGHGWSLAHAMGGCDIDRFEMVRQ